MIKLLYFANRFYSRLVALQNTDDEMSDKCSLSFSSLCLSLFVYTYNDKPDNLHGAQLHETHFTILPLCKIRKKK